MLYFNAKLDFNNKNLLKNIKYDGGYKPTWKYYNGQYAYCIRCIIEHGVQAPYTLNIAGHSIVCLFQHFIELNLKHNLELNKATIPKIHNLKQIEETYKNNNLTLPIGITALISQLDEYDKVGDGTCWRYYFDKKGNIFFPSICRLNFAIFIEIISSITNTEHFKINEDFCEINKLVQKKEWDFVFHLHEVRSTGNVRASFNWLIKVLIEGIIENKFLFNKLYLPLLYLIRHSLELGLKINIIEIQEVSELINKKDYSDEHSLEKLFNCLHGFLEKIEIEKLDEILQRQLNNYIKKYKMLNKIIHNLDTHSLTFRYPVNDEKKLILNKSVINSTNIFKLLNEIEPFLDFTTVVLKEVGVLELSAKDYGYYETMY